MDKEHIAHFPTAKIKKIIQCNQDIGKLSSTIPHLLQCSLQIFLEDILKHVNEIAAEEDFSKITPILIKRVLEKNKKYEFLKQFGNSIEEEETGKRKRNGDKEGKEGKAKKRRKQNQEKEEQEEDDS